MAFLELPAPELLRQLLDYDPETGALTWRERPASMFSRTSFGDYHRSAEWAQRKWNTRYAGKPAFTSTDGKYLQGSINNVRYKAHRVAWAIYHGQRPDSSLDIDHINGDKTDNRIENLRLVSRGENMRNARVPSHNTSGVLGVSYAKNMGKWHAYISRRGCWVNLGYYDTKEEAAAARMAANARHGFHRNHGRRPAAGEAALGRRE